MCAPSFVLKCERARRHFQAFNVEASNWADTEPYEVVNEPGPEPALQPLPPGAIANRFRVTRADEIPEMLPLILGDCLFNLRSAMDHLALALARKHNPRMTDDDIRNCYFPVAHQTPGRKYRERLAFFELAVQKIIDLLQPYHRGNGYATHPLWQIHDLCNIDKHRSLMVCGAASIFDGKPGIGVQDASIDNVLRMASVRVIKTRLERDAVLLRWCCVPVDPEQHVRMKPKVEVKVVFQDGPLADKPVVPQLEALYNFVSDSVISPLRKFL